MSKGTELKMDKSLVMQPESLPSLIEVIFAREVADFDTCPPIISSASVFSELQTAHSVSISMPPSPLHDAKREADAAPKFYSQPMPTPKPKKMLDKRFDSFKTHLSHQEHVQLQNFPVDRYFDALQGPELDTLRASEEIVLPEDKKWPFHLRFPITSFGICLGVSSQANMWKAIASTNSIHVAPDMNLALWFISMALFFIVALIYALKILLYFEAVRREYHHPIRVNFFFAPWITLLFLAHSLPPSLSHTPHQSLWYVLMAPILCLELKIYGQWMSGGQRRLSKVANPSNHLSVVGNFAGALLGATMGLKEGPVFFFAIGVAHYVVLFVTLYQRLPTNETLPKELHPVFFLFVAAPSVASIAWATIQGSFDHGSRIAYFIALFLYVSLAVRVNFFRGFRFSLACWAYTFPMTGAAIATINYSEAVTTLFTKALALTLCLIATLTLTVLLVTTIIHAFILRDLFPNDIAIAISERRPKSSRRSRWYRRRSGSSDSSIDRYLKHAQSDVEASPNNQDSSTVSVAT